MELPACPTMILQGNLMTDELRAWEEIVIRAVVRVSCTLFHYLCPAQFHNMIRRLQQLEKAASALEPAAGKRKKTRDKVIAYGEDLLFGPG